MSMKKYFLSIVFLMGLPLTAWGQFTLSGSTITHTGTSTDLTGLASVSGVSTYTEGERTIYDIGANAIYFDGTLTIDGTTEGIVSTNTGWAFRFRPNADVTINDFTDENSVKTYHEDKVLSAGKDGGVYFDAGATLNMNGGWFECKGVATPESLQNTINLNIEYGVFGSYKYTNTEQFRTYTQNLNVTGKLILIKMGYTLRTTLSNVMNSFETRYGGTSTWTSGSAPAGENEFKNFSSIGTTDIVRLWASKKTVFINTEKGTDYGVTNNSLGHTSSTGTVQIKKEVQPKLVDASGNAIQGAVVFIRDTDNGNRTDGNGYTFSTDKTYTETTDANGQTQVFEVLTGVVNEPSYDASPDWDYRSKNGNTDDEFDLHFWHYQKVYSSSTQELKGLNTLSFDWILFDDTNLSETTKATVDAYTEIDDLDKLYDRAKSWKVDSANLEHPSIDALLISVSGATLDLDDHDLVIDASAASAFAVDKTNKKITIKASTLAMGNTFTAIKTTGTISTANSATIEFGYEDSTGKNKFVHLDWGDTVAQNVTVTNLDNSNALINNVSATKTYKGHFVMPSPAPTNGIRVEIKTPTGYTVFQDIFPEDDLNFIRLDVTLTASEERQIEMLFLTRKILQKSEGINEALTGTTPSITDNSTTTNTTSNATNENQVAILQLLRTVLNKVSANREAMQKE